MVSILQNGDSVFHRWIHTWIDHIMILEGLMGLILTVSGGSNESTVDPAQLVLKGIMHGNKIIQKEKNKELDDSIHEELHQMTKDYIYKLGRK